jgi:histidyl-tRNA synthetase
MSPETAEAYKTNKLAVFYSQDEDDKILAASAPSILKFLKKDSKKHHEAFKMYLDDLEIPYIEDHTLFFSEGFYTNSIWQLDDSKGSVIATGGRYNTLARDL